jgi:hypothetical protein
MRKSISTLVFLIGFSFFGFPQVNIHSFVNKTDSSNTLRIVNLTKLWTFYTPFINKSMQLTITNHKTNHSIILLPNSKTSFGLNVIHKWFGLGIAFGLSQSKTNIERFGQTKQFDFQLNSYMRSMVLDFRIQAYKGFYRSDAPPDKNDIFPQAPNFSTYSLGGSLLFFTNKKKFSYKAAYTRSEIQLKSAGSFNYGFYVDMDGANDPDNFSTLNITRWPNEFNLHSYNSGGIGFIFGYSYTFVIKKFFFFNLSASPKFGLRYLNYQQSNGDKKTRLIGAGGAIFRLSIGYEGKRLFYGLSSVSQSNSYSQKGYEIEPKAIVTKLFMGMRF